jgi:hypothetical protein
LISAKVSANVSRFGDDQAGQLVFGGDLSQIDCKDEVEEMEGQTMATVNKNLATLWHERITGSNVPAVPGLTVFQFSPDYLVMESLSRNGLSATRPRPSLEVHTLHSFDGSYNNLNEYISFFCSVSSCYVGRRSVATRGRLLAFRHCTFASQYSPNPYPSDNGLKARTSAVSAFDGSHNNNLYEYLYFFCNVSILLS